MASAIFNIYGGILVELIVPVFVIENSYFPNLLCRLLYSSSASSKSRFVSSGHFLSVKTSSLYAAWNGMKFDSRLSPPVRKTRSGYGWPFV